MVFASEIFFITILLLIHQTNSRFEMRLKFYLVVIVVSTFQCNKVFWNLVKTFYGRFDGVCCGGQDL